MTFSDKQVRALRAKLAHRHVKTRQSNGTNIAYVEGWHVIAEANRIFGFDNWDRRTIQPRCLWSESDKGNTICFYSTKVRISVRAGEERVVREGIGTGTGKAAQADLAHEIALKAAETDATKRALATFGNPFGLALYDKGQSGVSKPRRLEAHRATDRSALTGKNFKGPFRLTDPAGVDCTFATQEELLSELHRQLEGTKTLKALYAFWEDNKANFSGLRENPDTKDLGERIIFSLKERARAFNTTVEINGLASAHSSHRAPHQGSQSDTAYLIPKEKRIRNRPHLEHVRLNPCLICGRRPVHAHHLRFAQKRAMGMKVSDEFTVPLCSIHHDEVHRTADERAWWARHGIIEPLKVAEKLWAQSRGLNELEEKSRPEGETTRATENRPSDPPI